MLIVILLVNLATLALLGFGVCFGPRLIYKYMIFPELSKLMIAVTDIVDRLDTIVASLSKIERE